MAVMYNVSRQTVRDALRLLENDGYIIKKHGSGIYVSDNWFSQKNRIALLIESEEDYIYPVLISNLKEAMHEYGYALDVFCTNSRYDKEREILLSFDTQPVRGVISIPIKSALPNLNINLYGRLISRHIPVLFLLDNYRDASDINYVCYDDFYAVYNMTCELLKETDDIYGIFLCDECRSLERYHGFIQGMLENGRKVSDDHILWLTSGHISSIRKGHPIHELTDFTRMISDNSHKTKGLICHNDEVAASVSDMIDKNLLPTYIYSFDKSYLSRLSEYSFISYALPPSELAGHASKQLISLINDKKVGNKILLPTK